MDWYGIQSWMNAKDVDGMQELIGDWESGSVNVELTQVEV